MRACAGKNWLPEAERKEWEESKKPKVEYESLLIEETKKPEQISQGDCQYFCV